MRATSCSGGLARRRGTRSAKEPNDYRPVLWGAPGWLPKSYKIKILAREYLEIVTCGMTALSHKDRALALAHKQAVVRAREFGAKGVPRVTLHRLVSDGVLIQPSRGLYRKRCERATY